ncbi:MAG: hypothetical protein DME12_07265 [Candidatus Rokuibacteriota bacterium]|nr:MAG: hypothetical protein DME12_07265 [Candidatus Rokubacteria bacterium]
MEALVDASGKGLALDRAPRRIVSLIPSTTETLCALGLADALVGVTVYCREPAEVTRTKRKIGGEKTPDLDAIRALGPDLVVANVEENVREHIEQLRAWAIPVWVTYPRTVADGLRLIRELGEVTGTRERAAAILRELEPLYERVRVADGHPRRGRGAAAGRDPPARRAVPVPPRPREGLRAVRRHARRPRRARPPRGRKALFVARAAHRGSAPHDSPTPRRLTRQRFGPVGRNVSSHGAAAARKSPGIATPAIRPRIERKTSEMSVESRSSSEVMGPPTIRCRSICGCQASAAARDGLRSARCG